MRLVVVMMLGICVPSIAMGVAEVVGDAEPVRAETATPPAPGEPRPKAFTGLDETRVVLVRATRPVEGDGEKPR